MTVLHEPVARPTVHEPEVLFREARQRRRRRWLISGITGSVLIVLIAVTIALGSSTGSGDAASKVGRAPAPPTGAARPAASLSFRPVLCYAPAFTLAPGQHVSSGPLPSCSPSSQLTASHLQFAPNSNNVNGYTSNTQIAADPQFATYPSTVRAAYRSDQAVLLPGVASEGSARYVLGPAALTQAGVQSASAQLTYGQWVIDLVLNPRGSTEWDALTHAQFHALIGVVFNGRVISAPITQPTQSSWNSFNGLAQISGSFTAQQAKAIAAAL